MPGGAETEDFIKKDQKIPFTKPIWAVARAICEAGMDPCSMNKKEVYAWADHVLFGGPAPVVDATVARSTPPASLERKVTTPSDEEPVATINVSPRVAIYTLLVSARELARLDKKSGGEELGNLIDVPAMAYLQALNKKSESHQPVVEPHEATAEAEPAEATVESAPVPIPA